MVRHPHAVADLRHEEGNVFEDADPDGLTHRIKRDLPAFLRKMKAIAPLLLDRAGRPWRHTESFLRFIHCKPTLDRFVAAASVRDELVPTLTDFRKTLGPDAGWSQWEINRTVIDTILWQVAFAVVSGRRANGASVWAAVDREAKKLLGQLSGRTAYQAAVEAANAQADVFELIETEYDRLA